MKPNSFERQDGPEGAVFNVRPARAPWIAHLVTAAVFGPVLYFIMREAVSAPDIKSALGSIFLFVLAAVILWLLGLRNMFKDLRYRRRETLAAGENGLRKGNQHIERDQIAEIRVRLAGPATTKTVSSRTPSLVVGGTGLVGPAAAAGAAAAHGVTETAAAVGSAWRRRIAERSYFVELRTRRGSETIILAFGLKADCVTDLMNDLAEVLS